MKNSLIIPISNDPVTGLARQAQLEAFIIQPDLNMISQLRISYRTPEGGSKLDAIAADQTLSAYQVQVAREQFADRVVSRQTGGSFVIPQTGQLVAEGTPGAISQRDYFQGVKLGDLKALVLAIDDNTTLAELMYAMISIETSKSDTRREI